MTQKHDTKQQTAAAVEYRFVPYSQEAEQAVIGATLVNPEAFRQLAADDLRVDDFYFVRHGDIWQAMDRIATRGGDIDFVTLTEELRQHDKLQEIGGTAYLLQLANNTPSTMHAMTYARLVKRASIRRRCLAALDAMRDTILDESQSIETALLNAETAWRAASTRRVDVPDSAVGAYTSAVLGDVEAVYEGNVAPTIPTGIKDAELRRGQVTVTGGASGFGKTSFIVGTCGLNIAQLNRTTVIFTNEETVEETTLRLACAHAGLRLQDVATGSIGAAGWSRISAALGYIGALKHLHIIYSPELTPGDIDKHLDRIGADYALDLVIVDGLKSLEPDPLIAPNGKPMPDNRSRTQQMKSIMKRLTAIAADRRVAMLCAHHFNRDEDGHGNEPPSIRNLAESSAIEQYAQTIWALWRPSGEDEVFEGGEGGAPTTLISLKDRFTSKFQTRMVFRVHGNTYVTDDGKRQLIDLRSDKKRAKDEGHPF